MQPNRKRSCMEEAAGMRVASSGMGLLKNLYNFNGGFYMGKFTSSFKRSLTVQNGTFWQKNKS